MQSFPGAISLKQTTSAMALAGLLAVLPFGQAGAQQNDRLPSILVTASRLGVGVVGASTSLITSEDIARSPSRTLTEILSREAGIQTQNMLGGVNGARSAVDMRGFGAAAASNTLILIDGRRVQDADMTGFDFASIPLESIERIEITRGNSGAVLYGDGAVGGVINIVTKTGGGRAPSIRVDGGAGSFNTKEGNVSASGSFGPWSVAAFGNTIDSDGYRQNNDYRQHNGVGDLRYTGQDGSVYLNLSADQQRVGLPGGRLVDPTTGTNELASNPRGAATPWDYANKDGINLTAGFTRMLDLGSELIVDGGVRRKDQEGGFFGSGPTPFPWAFVDSRLTTVSLTPRLNIDRTLFGMPSRILTGIDYIHADYDSDRYPSEGALMDRRYDITQTSLAGYWQQSVNVSHATEISFGGRLQRNEIKARDNCFVCDMYNPQGLPLDENKTEYAWHVGLEHKLNQNVAVFGRAARSFRVPNVDERVGMAPWDAPTTFHLKTQTSNDYEGGVRLQWDRVRLQSSIYLMELDNELQYDPIAFVNRNLEPTRRIGVETIGSWQIVDNVRLNGGLTYIDAEFREGQNAGNEVPLVSKWTGNVGLSWDIWQKWLVLDTSVRYIGERRLDNDQANVQPMIGDHTLVDVRLGGENERLYWSFAVQNVFDEDYFDYGIASVSVPPVPSVIGRYNAYPLAGRTFLGRFGLKF